MKNLMRSVMIVLAVGLFMIPVSAECFADTQVKQLQLAQSEIVYVKIQISEVPERVIKSAAARYAGYTIEAAAKGTDCSFKLFIKCHEVILVVYFSENGEFLDEEIIRMEGMI